MTVCPLSRARWIWPGKAPYAHNTHAQYRRDFDLQRVPDEAPFHITADHAYMLYVNGRYVGRGPARGYQRSWPYDTYDIAPYLRSGHNWISVRHYNGGISTFGYIFEWRAGMLCAGVWDGLELLSDERWLSRVSPAVRADVRRVSTQLNLQEQVDGRLDDQAWIASPTPPTTWTEATTTLPYGSMPWHAIEPRGIPNLTGGVLAYERTCAQASGPCADGWDDTPDVAAPFRIEGPAAAWTEAPPAAAEGDGLELRLQPAGKGRFAAVTIDLGCLSVGTLIVEADGAAGGETLDFHFTELLIEDGAPLVPNTISMACRLILAEGRTRHEFFHIMGHRYLTVVARDAERPLRVRLALRETIYPLEVVGRFDCDDPTLNAIHRICVRTQRICALDSYVDTPWREQAQWWGDARVQAANTFHLADDTRLLARGIRSIARQEVPNGLTYGHAPTNSHACILPDFSITWVLSLWDHYWQTGRTDLFVEQWPRVQRLLGYFRGEGRGANGLLRYDRRYWLFLDWSTLPKEQTPTLLNLWYIIMLDRLARLAALAGMTGEAVEFERQRDNHAALTDRLLWDAQAGLFRDGLDDAERPLASWSVHSQTAAILANLRPEHHAAMAAARLLPFLQGRELTDPLPSSFWVHYVYEAMVQAGHGREVIDHIRRNYAPMIPSGGAWEIFGWNADRSSTLVWSNSHAWSAHPIKHLAATLGGITQTGAAWRRIRFAPVLDDPQVGRADVTVPTPHGLIRAAWSCTEGQAEVSLDLPDGVQAATVLPGEAPGSAAGSARWRVRVG
ncbi:MAG: alpha-L-rhamnosidase [Planctomycetes bacterium]|nr:alpha-L-rhamnosidase [Planctomycetota bacterium]